MTEMQVPPAALRVGELADATGLTVRTLHHYEAIGLLAPSSRSAAGHRMYGPEVVERLYRVASLRRMRLSLEQIRRALDEPDWSLADELVRHLDGLEAEIDQLHRVRSSLRTALEEVSSEHDPTQDLLEALGALSALHPPPLRRISLLVYRDLRAAHRFLADVLGLVPGEVTEDGDGQVVHAEVWAGDGVVWLHPESEQFALASPATLGAATATMAVLVDDVDAHHRGVVGRGGQVVYGPVDQPYGYREYAVRDPEGTLWSFMKELEAVD